MRMGAQAATGTAAVKRPAPIPPTRARPLSPATFSVGSSVLRLHTTLGNRTVQKIVRSPELRARFGIGKPVDLAGKQVVAGRPQAHAHAAGASSGRYAGVTRPIRHCRAGRLLPSQSSWARRPAGTADQAQASVQRLTEADLIKGKFTGQFEYPDRVFFDFGSDRVDESQQKRIGNYFGDKPDMSIPVTLTGLASEEGNTSYNLGLAARRANEVKKYILRIRPKAVIRLIPPRVESGVIDYRFVRAVVLNERTDGRHGGGADQPAKCDLENLKKLQDKALALVVAAQGNAGKVDFEPAIRLLFGDPAPKDAIKGNLVALHEKLGKILEAGAYECAGLDTPVCSSGALAFANQKTNKISYCPASPSAPQKDEREQVNTMIHETLHITPGAFTKDYAYASDPLISQLRQAEALHNTDSYVILIRQLANSVAPPQARFEGTTSGFNDQERDQIREAIGWAMSSVKGAQFQVAILYEAVHLTRTSGTWPESQSAYIDLYKRLAPLFGLTRLTGAGRPRDEDKWKLASAHDKFKSLVVAVNPDIKKYDINRDDGVPFVAFDFRPMFAIVKIASRFLPLSLDERIKKVLLEIVTQGQLTPNYASAIVEIRDFMGIKWPV
jgi:outer membrane protein OmpA-like peptidoglycan-associated protein/predicted metallopeptidase